MDLRAILNAPILRMGGTTLTLSLLLYLLVLVLLLVFVTGRVKKWLVTKALVRTRLDLGARQAAGSIFQYGVVLLGFLIILQTAGIDLTTLNVLAGALGIGLGFSLQSVASNFVSGLIILFERPVKLGDRIDVGGVEGDVVQIGARATTVVTNDNIAIIIPNLKFVTENVINWSHTDRTVRFRVPVGVAYGSDIHKVEKVLLEVAAENRDVLRNPPPAVRLMEFGDNALLFELRVWSDSLIHRRGQLVSSINYAIYERFREHAIEIAFPQRDLHFPGGVDVRLQSSGS
jgi:small-conductance mechanosensitive channel